MRRSAGGTRLARVLLARRRGAFDSAEFLGEDLADEAFDFFAARRHLTCAGARVKAGDEVVELRDLLFPLLIV